MAGTWQCSITLAVAVCISGQALRWQPDREDFLPPAVETEPPILDHYNQARKDMGDVVSTLTGGTDRSVTDR